MIERLVVSEEFDGVRADKFISGVLEGSRSYLSGLIADGRVKVNGKVIKASFKVSKEDVIEVDMPEIKPLSDTVEAVDIPLDIVYEDDDIIIINKPKGMVVHPAVGHMDDTLVNALLFHCGDSLSDINGVLRPGIVHRIDMDTTGLLVVAKNNKAHQSLSDQLSVHSITRRYQAIVHGVIKEDSGTIDKPIGRHKIDRKKMSVDAPVSREAVTHFKVLERFKSYTYIECELETGRTHQIRVHMSSIGHPLLGDEVYGPKKCPFKGLQGQTLHAKVIGFIHPSSGEYVEFDSELPEYFEDLLKKLRAQS
ncbi:MAG: RluA family pseudouridine synthase [Lachnospiraceae bacterium]|nr:RluA family pseudouridine synthase [Lachnospiraceae bacterium]